MNRIFRFLRNTGEKIRLTHPLIQIVAFCAFAALLSAAFIHAAAPPRAIRSVFYYPDTLTKKTRIEARHLPRQKTADDRLVRYVEELLLGPIEEDRDPLFSGRVSLKSAFIRGRDAYIDLSAEALERGEKEIPWPDARDLFLKNVFTNFAKIARIYIYIDGVEVYGGTSANAESKK